MRVFLSAILLGAATLPAVAQSGCVTVGQAVCGPTNEPRLGKTDGDVRVSRGTGFTKIVDGSALSVGDRLFIGRGQGSVQLGSCMVPLKSYSVVWVVPGEGGMCVANGASERPAEQTFTSPAAPNVNSAPVNMAASAVQQKPALAAVGPAITQEPATVGGRTLASVSQLPPPIAISSTPQPPAEPLMGMSAKESCDSPSRRDDDDCKRPRAAMLGGGLAVAVGVGVAGAGAGAAYFLLKKADKPGGSTVSP